MKIMLVCMLRKVSSEVLKSPKMKSIICAKTGIQAQADVFTLAGRDVQGAFQSVNSILERILAQLITGIEQRTDALIILGGSDTTQLAAACPLFPLK